MTEEPHLTPEQLDSIRQVAFARELLAAASPPKEKHGLWLRMLESTGAVALSSLLLGSVLTGTTSWLLAERSFRRELAVKQLEHTEQLSREYRAQRLDAVVKIHERVASIIASSEDLLTIAGGGFDSELLAAREHVAAANRQDEEWRRSKLGLTLLVRIYFQHDAGAEGAWTRLLGATDEYCESAQSAYYAWNRAMRDQKTSGGGAALSGVRTAAVAKKIGVTKAIEDFDRALAPLLVDSSVH